MEAILTLVGLICIIPLLIIYSSFSWGYVATVFWTWFILPIFPQSPIFTWAQLAGIMFVVNCFVHSSKTAVKEEYKDSSSEILLGILGPWLALFGGWIFHSLIY